MKHGSVARERVGLVGPIQDGSLKILFGFNQKSPAILILYTIDVENGERKALTSGKYEVQQAEFQRTKNIFISLQMKCTRENKIYRLLVTGGKAERITTMTGANQVTISPDEKYIAFFILIKQTLGTLPAGKQPGGKIEQITKKAMSDEFKSYPWRIPR